MKRDRLLYDGYLKIEETKDVIKGKVVKRERLIAADAVAAILIDESGRFGLVKQYRPTVDRYTYELVAGTCDKEMSDADILLEEIYEECEISPEDVLELKSIHQYYVMIGISNTKLNLFAASVRNQTDKQVSDADVEEVIWVTMGEFARMVEQGDIQDSKTLLGYYYALAMGL
ncbi:8-oxo-dGTP pyrophosphatase MutT (NUDIX family) [Bacillus thermophilus]|uniref:NUDIX hydrolase n=2 Tax=Siminovitchia TaxID=2837510 RepID=A0A429X9M8_SIMTE|nr:MULTISPECIES: NUDIX hydrolase [Siminovitchia]MBM7715339.1 8-oxo-dGTP pyrophosphatase MutT (NUDIX family) [Siminovitchia thermophila]RST60135.1 NUDIX hydrolase [Siminovitchia terrae]